MMKSGQYSMERHPREKAVGRCWSSLRLTERLESKQSQAVHHSPRFVPGLFIKHMRKFKSQHGVHSTAPHCICTCRKTHTNATGTFSLFLYPPFCIQHHPLVDAGLSAVATDAASLGLTGLDFVDLPSLAKEAHPHQTAMVAASQLSIRTGVSSSSEQMCPGGNQCVRAGVSARGLLPRSSKELDESVKKYPKVVALVRGEIKTRSEH